MDRQSAKPLGSRPITLAFALCKILRARRIERGLTCRQVAEHLGLKPRSFYRVERRDTELTVDRLGQLARLYSVSVLDLVREAEAASGQDWRKRSISPGGAK